MLIPNGTLILAVDGGRMTLLRYQMGGGRRVLEPLLERHSSNPPDRQTGTDSPGRRFESMGTGSSSYEGGNWHDQQEEQFASECLADALSFDDDAKLVLIAPPHMLGLLRDKIGKADRERIVSEIAKDYAGFEPQEITKLLSLE